MKALTCLTILPSGGVVASFEAGLKRFRKVENLAAWMQEPAPKKRQAKAARTGGAS